LPELREYLRFFARLGMCFSSAVHRESLQSKQVSFAARRLTRAWQPLADRAAFLALRCLLGAPLVGRLLLAARIALDPLMLPLVLAVIRPLPPVSPVVVLAPTRS
jgi:hypothetical protein